MSLNNKMSVTSAPRHGHRGSSLFDDHKRKKNQRRDIESKHEGDEDYWEHWEHWPNTTVHIVSRDFVDLDDVDQLIPPLPPPLPEVIRVRRELSCKLPS